ncbi:MAG: sigma-70 family RNA polymerase sigma factor [Cyclobacteriaceae bacterium]|nr:sigma-70 family RNA polymerase sigma factor [Cyclobacteriaceae bacterium]
MTAETFKSRILPMKGKFYRYAFSILRNQDLAMDIVQETFMKVWEKRAEMHGIQNPEAWCMTLTRNFALEKLRSKFHRSVDMDAVGQQETGLPSPLQQTEMAETMALIDKIVDRLPLKQKESFLLRDVEGFSYQEISDITGHSVSDVKVCIFRARNVIRNRLVKLQSHGLEKTGTVGR